MSAAAFPVISKKILQSVTMKRDIHPYGDNDPTTLRCKGPANDRATVSSATTAFNNSLLDEEERAGEGHEMSRWASVFGGTSIC
jgi:hypothetical protein